MQAMRRLHWQAKGRLKRLPNVRWACDEPRLNA
jgi:hypothetical protein